MASTNYGRGRTTQTPPPAKKSSGCAGFLFKLIGICFLIFFISIFMGICDDMEDSSEEVKTTESHGREPVNLLEEQTMEMSVAETEPEISEADRLPNIPEELRSNFFLNCRMKGNCRSMTGDVLTMIVFVNDGESSWTMEDMERIKQANNNAAIRQKEMAAEYGAELNISLAYCELTIAELVSDDLFYYQVDSILTHAGLPESEHFSDSLKDVYGVDEVTVFFYLNKTGRAFSMEMDSATGAEYAFYYRLDGDFRHEMNHIFGAMDYYYPSAAKAIAEKYWPDSIMLTGGDVMDPLSAYLVGWTDQVPEQVISFLQETSHITSEMVWAELEEELYTGYVENSRRGNAVYTGHLVDGVMNGYGSVIYDDGNSYEGDWEYGLFHGYGTYRWSDGSSYVGEWYEGYMHGEGTIYYYNGTTQTGTWNKGEFVG